MRKPRRRAVMDVDTDKTLELLIDHFLYDQAQKFYKSGSDLVRLAKSMPSPSDWGAIRYHNHALSVIDDIRCRNIPNLKKRIL